jgi:hypothetical protein
VAHAAGIGITTILTPVRARNVNAIAERVIGTLRCESLDHVSAINDRHLRRMRFCPRHAVLGGLHHVYRRGRPDARSSFRAPQNPVSRSNSPVLAVLPCSSDVFGDLEATPHVDSPSIPGVYSDVSTKYRPANCTGSGR